MTQQHRRRRLRQSPTAASAPSYLLATYAFFFLASLAIPLFASRTMASAFPPVLTTRPAALHQSNSNNRVLMNPGKATTTTTTGTKALSTTSLEMLNLRGGAIGNAWGIYIVSDIVGFLISVVTGWHVHLDLIGTGAFALAALPGLTSVARHIQWSSLAVVTWGTKLALFLFFRAAQTGHDMRLEEQLSTVKGMSEFWGFTLLWQVCISLPNVLGMLPSSAAENSTSRLYTWCTKGGGLLYLLGLTIETLADAQKWFFRQSHASNEFCNVGLWGISQHPNFWGNMVLWMGILVMNIPALTTTVTKGNNIVLAFVKKYWKFAAALISPWFAYTLFQGQAEGSFLTSVDLANSKYGHDPNYAKYTTEVPLIFPNLLQVFTKR